MISQKLSSALISLYVRSVLLLKSFSNRFRSWFHSDTLLLNKPYNGQKILLIALYEKSTLRNDIKNLLQIAKEKDLYVIGVNTQKLLRDEPISRWFDCYIERYNFGRDFGSYKVGFKHIFKNKYQEKCSRLIMVNDSVFYESTRSGKFLNDLMTTDIEALGATENYEFNHHLGSFCISIAGRILRLKPFQQFWRSYKNSEIRPVVIERGEMALSICLKRLVASPEHFRALYDTALLIKNLETQEDFLEICLKMARRSSRFLPSVIHPRNLWDRFFEHFFISDVKKFNSKLFCYPVFDLQNMQEIIKNFSSVTPEEVLPHLKQFISAEIIKSFRVSSQIHVNCCLLLYLGLPIVKLDGFYRGALSEEDILILSSQMQQQEADELKVLLLRNSFGGDSLFGWKRYLFNRGLI